MTLVVQVCDQPEVLLNGLAIGQCALLIEAVAYLHGCQLIGLLPDAGQVAVLEGDAIGPTVGLASGKEALIG